jgi:hypothetical protein
MATQPTTLQSRAQDPVSLLSIPDTEILQLIHDDFSDELDRLKRAYSIRSQNITPLSTLSPSQILYGEDYDEVNRTLVGILALRWIYNNQYATFTTNQPDPVKLSQASFSWLHNLFTSTLTNAPTTFTDLYALITSMVVNDLGKDPQLACDYHATTDEDIAALNHDMILLKAVNAGLVGCLDRLPADDRADIVRGMELGSEFNFGQLAQAENAPACLASLRAMKGHDRAFRLRFMEQLLDIAGAEGHMDWMGGKKLIEPIFEAYRNVYDVATGIISGRLSLREGYDLILTRRAKLLREKGFRVLDVKDPQDRALMRVLCMGGVAGLETARLYEASWASLESSVRQSLVKSLNVDGSLAEPAVQPTYMPALLAAAVDVGEKEAGNQDTRQKALQSALRYLSRVMTIAKKPPGPVTVIECSVLEVLKDVVQSSEFRSNPGILDTVAVPESVVAMRS